MQTYQEIRQLINRVRRRWRTLRLLSATMRSALAVALVLGVALVASRWTNGAPAALAVIGIGSVVCLVASVLWGALPLRDVPDDRRVARFVEEREPSLDDRLVSAVDAAAARRELPEAAQGLVEPMLADTARRLRHVSLDAIIPGETMRRAASRALAAAAIAMALLFSARHVARQAVDAASLLLFPSRVVVEVTPGNTRVKAGEALGIQARLVGNGAPVMAQVQIATGASGTGEEVAWRSLDMASETPGTFRLAMNQVWTSFRYRVAAGAVTSPTYEITVVKPPRVTRIDVDYAYPAGLQLPPRTEEDGGDIYAPPGTEARLHVVTDPPAVMGRLSLANGQTLELTPEAATGSDSHVAGGADHANRWSGVLKVTDDGSYRVALTDREGLSNPGDTEYFIRVLEDRPPVVHVIRPGSDRSVTRLEEVEVEAQAEDDYGIDRLDLIYSVRGEAEQVVPLKIPRNATTVSGRQTLYLEDLNVAPGDFISYYVRARDVTRGARPNEARSDIFFLEVKPYEQEFAVAQSQSAAAGGGGRGELDDLIAAQKDVIVATWKIDRRAQAMRGRTPAPGNPGTAGAPNVPDNIRSIARAESELKSRVERASSSFRESVMRDPRRRPQSPRGGRGGPPGPEPLRAGQTMAEEDEMTAASEAMAQAAASLDALKTAEARSPEMEALNHLLRAQADVKKRDVMRQQTGSGAGTTRSNYDLSTLFDKELQKQQQTNYETRSSSEERKDQQESALDRVHELARREEALLKRQEELARNREKLTAEELKREVEKLTREQSELRQRAEELAPKMGQQMRDASEAMRSATNDLRRQESGQAGQASAAQSRALDALRNLERQMQSGQPDERRRALGEMQLEARQLADEQRQVASEVGRATPGEAGNDALRRLAGDEERLADRARRLQEALKRQPASADAARDAERQRLSDRMQQSADAIRAAGERKPGPQRGSTAPSAPSPGIDELRAQAAGQQELARSLDRLADRLVSPGGGSKDGEAGKLSTELARAQQLQDRFDQLAEQMKQLAAGGRGSAGGRGDPAGRGDPGGRGTSGGRGDVAGRGDAGGRGEAGGRGDAGGGRGDSNARGDSGARGGSGGGGEGRDSNGQQGQASAQTSSALRMPGEPSRAGQGQGQGAGPGNGSLDAARLREEVQRAMQETRELMEQLRREDPSFSRGGAGFTFEGQGLTTTAPGTEAFKQDFAKWEDLRRQATTALENAQSSLAKRLQAKESKERLAAGADDKAPPEYRKQVDDYFKAIAKKKTER